MTSGALLLRAGVLDDTVLVTYPNARLASSLFGRSLQYGGWHCVGDAMARCAGLVGVWHEGMNDPTDVYRPNPTDVYRPNWPRFQFDSLTRRPSSTPVPYSFRQHAPTTRKEYCLCG